MNERLEKVLRARKYIRKATNLYNQLCRKCQLKGARLVVGHQEIKRDDLCDKCKKKYDKIFPKGKNG